MIYIPVIIVSNEKNEVGTLIMGEIFQHILKSHQIHSFRNVNNR